MVTRYLSPPWASMHVGVTDLLVCQDSGSLWVLLSVQEPPPWCYCHLYMMSTCSSTLSLLIPDSYKDEEGLTSSSQETRKLLDRTQVWAIQRPFRFSIYNIRVPAYSCAGWKQHRVISGQVQPMVYNLSWILKRTFFPPHCDVLELGFTLLSVILLGFCLFVSLCGFPSE